MTYSHSPCLALLWLLDILLNFVLLHRRPGVLVLINDADWELEGGPQYELKDNDNIFFVSTLHGG